MKKLEVEELLEAQELKERISELLRLVEEEGETIEVTRDGEVITRLVPPARTSKQPVEQSDAAAWADLKQIASELAPNWPDKDVNAVEIVRDVRRDLPVNEPKQSPKRDVHAFWRRIDQLAAQVGTHVSEKVDAVKIVRVCFLICPTLTTKLAAIHHSFYLAFAARKMMWLDNQYVDV